MDQNVDVTFLMSINFYYYYFISHINFKCTLTVMTVRVNWLHNVVSQNPLRGNLCILGCDIPIDLINASLVALWDW